MVAWWRPATVGLRPPPDAQQPVPGPPRAPQAPALGPGHSHLQCPPLGPRGPAALHWAPLSLGPSRQWGAGSEWSPSTKGGPWPCPVGHAVALGNSRHAVMKSVGGPASGTAAPCGLQFPLQGSKAHCGSPSCHSSDKATAGHRPPAGRAAHSLPSPGCFPATLQVTRPADTAPGAPPHRDIPRRAWCPRPLSLRTAPWV